MNLHKIKCLKSQEKQACHKSRPDEQVCNDISFEKQMKKRAWDLVWFCLFFITICFVTLGSVTPLEAKEDFAPTNKQTRSLKAFNDNLAYLDRVARKFDSLSCAKNDVFCWWFLFHIRIGNTGSESMTRFAQKAYLSDDLDSDGFLFIGEGHIFQYPAYWLLKGVKSDTLLRAGYTFQDLIQNTDWPYIQQISADKEPSWYLMGRRFDSTLPKISPRYRGNLACGGSHYLVGLSVNPRHEELFEQELAEYMQNIDDAIQSFSETGMLDRQQSDLIAHAMETLCLSGRQDLISADLFWVSMAFTKQFKSDFESSFTANINSNNSINAFVTPNHEIAYITAEMLGHFRNGLKVCYGIEPNRLRK